jgi:halocyanin-like protein
MIGPSFNRREMVQSTAGVLGLLGLANVSAAQSQNTDDTTETVDRTGEDAVSVDVGAGENNTSFAPADIRISTGTTVVWEWTGNGGNHSVTETDGVFESETVSEAGHTFTQTFDTTGSYDYECVPHGDRGMVGSITVVESTPEQDETEQQQPTQDGTDQETEQQTEDVCEGTPTMARNSITTPQNKITADEPATVEANFRVDPTVPEECTVVVDLQYSFAQSGFQFGGGSGWDQSATDIVATRFDDLQSGEIRSIDAQIHTNGAEVGDEVTVIADYEIWYDGNQENSLQQSGIRETVTVEAINNPDEESEDEGISTSIEAPGFGLGTALAAVGSAGYMVKRRLTDSE